MDLTKFFAIAQAMASLARYSQTRLVAPENVLQHSGFVVLACYFICLEVNSRATNEDERIDMGELLSRAIIHDFDEIAVGDIARPTKYHSSETVAMFTKLKHIGICKLVKDLHLEPAIATRVLLDHDTAKEGRSGFIVDLADKLAVVFKLWDECLLRHNYTMIKNAVHLHERSFLPDLRRDIQKLQFNQEQSFCLHGYLSAMEKIVSIIAHKRSPVLGIVNEALG
jgi:5'-deoxynucleotidase YfbR-like HD superfamily hydrolase